MSDDRVTNVDAAALAGVAASTWRDYVARGYAPPADGRLGRTPWWHRDTITTWLEDRPGQGARTDLQASPTADRARFRALAEAIVRGDVQVGPRADTRSRSAPAPDSPSAERLRGNTEDVG